MIGRIGILDIARSEERYLSLTIRPYRLTRCDCPYQTKHYDAEVREGMHPALFVLLSRSEAICLIVHPGLHTYLH